MLKRRDALFDLLDALMCEGAVASFARLSQSERFMRKWPNLYAAVEDGELDCQWLRTYLAGQVPQTGLCVFPLDGTPWPRPRSRVLDDRQYVYQTSSDVNGGTVTVGYPYSLLECRVEPHSSWSLPVMCGECLVPKPHRKWVPHRSRLWPKRGAPVWRRWISWQWMANMGMLPSCAG
jgi:hypothetical protein